MVESDRLDCTKTAAERRAFGDKLRDLRTARRLSIESVANSTRIQARYIEALESGTYEKLPGEVFARGFVRNVSKAVDADPEAMVADFGRCWKGVAAAVAPSEIEPESLKQHVQKAPNRRRGPEKAGNGHARGIATYLAGLAAVGVVALVVRYSFEHRGNEIAVKPHAAVATAVPSASPAPAAIPAPVARTQKSPEMPDVVANPPTPPEPVADLPETLDTPRIVEGSKAAPSALPAKPAVAAPVEEPKPAAPVAETASVSLSPQAGATGPQSLEIVVSRPVKVKMTLDDGQSEIKDLKPDTYKLSFSDQANLLIYDASALTIIYNGRDLGSLGEKGRRRRLSFQSKKPDGASQF